MTLLSKELNGVSLSFAKPHAKNALTCGAPSLVSLSSSGDKNRLPRFNLKKRPMSAERGQDDVKLATVNSAFLTGLFADVAKVQVQSPVALSVSTDEDASGAQSDPTTPRKKMRLSKTKSMTRCAKSFKLLSEAEPISLQSVLASPNAAADFFGVDCERIETSGETISRDDSLHYQLGCVSDASNDSTQPLVDAGKLAFPHLPSTVGTSSCKLTRKVSDLQLFDSENPQHKDSYGWFVETDNEGHHQSNRFYTTPTPASSISLAFSAATAPNAASYDAEVEWAKAADTVDDVLGDFF